MPWWAIMTVPQREFDAVGALADRGLEAFTPVERKWVRVRRGPRPRAPRAYPMFRGYVFVASDRFPWGVLNADKHLLRGVVSCGGRPLQIPREQIDAVRRLSETVVPYCWAGDPHQALSVGVLVEIVEGPFAGQKTRIDAITMGRVTALIDLLGGPRAVEFDMDAVREAV